MSMTDLLEKVSNADFDRRKFFKRAGTAGLGIAATTMLGGAVEKLSATDLPPIFSPRIMRLSPVFVLPTGLAW